MGIEIAEGRSTEDQLVMDSIWQYWKMFSQGERTWKFDVMDMDEELHALATHYLQRYGGEFEYLVDLKRKGPIGLTQAKGVLNCAVAELKREHGMSGNRRVLTKPVPCGFYGLPSGVFVRYQDWKDKDPGTRVLSVLVAVKPKMQWQGVAASRPDKSWSVWGKHRDGEMEQATAEFFANDADYEAMGMVFAETLNRCCKCGRTLTIPIAKNKGRCAKCAQIIDEDEVNVPF